MTHPVEHEIARALSAGPLEMRELVRTLATRDDPAALRHGALWLRDHAEPSHGSPLAAALLVYAKRPQEAVDLYEQWLVDTEAPPSWHMALLAKAYRSLGDVGGVFRTAARMHPWDLDHEPRQAVGRLLAKVRDGGVPEGFRTLRFALLSSFTTTPIEPCLRVGAARLGLDLDLYVGEFDQLQLQIEDEGSEMYQHRPEVVLLATTWRDLAPDSTAEEQVEEWSRRWELLLERTSAQVLQHTFDRPIHQSLGHLAARDARSITRLAADVNAQLASRAPPRVSLVDYEHAIFRYGAQAWCDTRQWHWAKEAVRPEAAPHLVEEVVAILRALTGKTHKVLVLDLDNTMWGGIVGEQGVEGLSVGPPSVEGEAHQSLQRYAQELGRRGVLLAVCSKNNPEDARAPFEQLPDMVLKLTDFVAFEASWAPKPEKLRQMAADLELGLDSFVFVDDNPAERALMRRECPEVLTIPLPSDVSGYIEALERSRAFEVLSVSAEDRERAGHYRAERERRELRTTVGSLDAYWDSLEMVATLTPFTRGDQERVVQLAARSNQFNLTTWRLSQSEVDTLRSSPKHECRALRLRDRYGDYGLVLVMVTEVLDATDAEPSTLDVQALFMSCRVIGRSVEQLALAELDAIAITRGCTRIRGTFIPTKKNRKLVSDLYPRLGFQRASEHPDGTVVYLRSVDRDAPALNPHITVTRS